MIEWLYWLQLGVAIVAGLLAVGFATAKRTPNDYTLGSIVLLGVLLLVQMIVAAVQPALGNSPTGSLLEFWMYLVTAFLMVIAGAVWALVERSMMSNVMLGLLAGSIAVMLVRMDVIWTVNGT
jgi:predicted membrane channel-forming protein YqfA (hemolysin III family)